jgi:hypothetical protein
MLLCGRRWSRREDRYVPTLVRREACTRRALIVGFYFAVQSGGDFEVDYTVMDPDDKVLLEGVNERQGDYIFTANKVCRHASGSAVPGWSKV